MQGTPAVSLGGYFEVDFSREDYFEDYFFRKIVLRSKIVSESKIVSKWKINLKITLRANKPQNSLGRCVHLKYK